MAEYGEYRKDDSHSERSDLRYRLSLSNITKFMYDSIWRNAEFFHRG